MTVIERTSLRSLYLYLVCLVTLIIAIFATVSVVRNTVQLVYPDRGYYGVEPAFGPDGKGTQPSAEQQKRQESAARDSQRHQAVLGVVGSGTMLLLVGPVYLYHWRRVKDDGPAPRGAATPPQSDAA